jgi:hypothetical protein
VRKVELKRLVAQPRFVVCPALELERRRRDPEIGSEQPSSCEVGQFAASLLIWVVQRDDPDLQIALADRERA